MTEATEQLGFRRPSTAVLAGAALAVALVAWIVTAERMDGMDMGPGTHLGTLPFFVGVWVTMMAAMMLPSVLPMVLLFNRVSQGRRSAGKERASTLLFVLAYFAVWSCFGLAAYGVYRAVAAADLGFLAWDRRGPLVAGIAVAAAGVYELTPLKNLCLRHCRGPLHFVLHGWRSGNAGAIRMGVEHGAYCAGCCWGLMVILFALGVMSVTWMLVVAAVIFLQKVTPLGRYRLPVALLFVGLGIWIAAAPESVPFLVEPAAASDMEMS